MSSVFNFSAGPSTLPEAVLQKARDELLDWHDSGMSVIEMSHRGKAFVSIAKKTESDLRELLNIADNYKILFLQGGATSQFAMVPMNLVSDKNCANYVCTGAWSQKAIAEAKRFCDVHIVSSSAQGAFSSIPLEDTWNIDADGAYLHYTSNETIGGVEFQFVPNSKDMPLVVDMSSNILSRPIDINKFGLIYAGAQKNIGPSGITVVIVREDLIEKTLSGTPSMFDYRQHAESESMLNTPPTFNWYLLGLVLEWIKAEGGLESMERRNKNQSDKLYSAIDDSSLYANPVKRSCRSRMNIPFTLAGESLDEKFLSDAEDEGFVGLKGHRLVGGVRASLYNAMPDEAVDELIAFMVEFERIYG